MQACNISCWRFSVWLSSACLRILPSSYFTVIVRRNSSSVYLTALCIHSRNWFPNTTHSMLITIVFTRFTKISSYFLFDIMSQYYCCIASCFLIHFVYIYDYHYYDTKASHAVERGIPLLLVARIQNLGRWAR